MHHHPAPPITRGPGRSLVVSSLSTTLCAVVLLVGSTVLPSAAVAPSRTTAPPSPGWVQVSAGRDHTCAVRATGRLFCWGDDTYGQLGNGPPTGDRFAPAEVAGGATTWASVTAGEFHTCALKTNGRLFCWGNDHFDQLGDGGGSADQPSPVVIGGTGSVWSSVDAGTSHTCAITGTGVLRCWGLNVEGQVGSSLPDLDSSTPATVDGEASDWASVSAGGYHTCARKTDGRLFCWGRGVEGQVGDGSALDRGIPVEVASTAADWASVSAGGYHTCARKVDGRLFCWGNDVDGQTGTANAAVELTIPTREATAGRAWVSVSAGANQTCARKSTGRLFCWGNDSEGELGDGPPNADRHQAAEVAGGAVDWGQVSAGSFHTCARRSGGRLLCWGSDDDGELGNGEVTTADQRQPVPVR